MSFSKSVQEPLFRYILSLVRDSHLAEDILQVALASHINRGVMRVLKAVELLPEISLK